MAASTNAQMDIQGPVQILSVVEGDGRTRWTAKHERARNHDNIMFYIYEGRMGWIQNFESITKPHGSVNCVSNYNYTGIIGYIGSQRSQVSNWGWAWKQHRTERVLHDDLTRGEIMRFGWWIGNDK